MICSDTNMWIGFKHDKHNMAIIKVDTKPQYWDVRNLQFL